MRDRAQFRGQSSVSGTELSLRDRAKLEGTELSFGDRAKLEGQRSVLRTELSFGDKAQLEGTELIYTKPQKSFILSFMDKKHLIWTEEGRKQVFNCKVFSIWETYCKSPENQPNQSETKTFSVIDAMDWVIVIPIIDSPNGKQFVMVWQWRHGSKCLSLEFPGGVLEPEEIPENAAIRELHEETGYRPGKIEKIGEFFPNPAIMSNKVHFFLAENLSGGNTQNLDDDEYVEVVLIDTEEVFQNMGKEPYVHALMGTALSLYNQKKN